MTEMELKSPDEIGSPHLLCNFKIFQYSGEQMLFIVFFFAKLRLYMFEAVYLMFSSYISKLNLYSLVKFELHEI